jgi:hypothetical protein
MTALQFRDMPIRGGQVVIGGGTDMLSHFLEKLTTLITVMRGTVMHHFQYGY